ncbi:MAG: heat-inducible transcription repressor HrcA [Erysipelotrichaceae bacterium]|nr:heat-inducible transcription repressor HrcA [Erysipelotrichaceae bacterium]
MLTNRQIDIFKAIVEEFIETAEPVGSKTLVTKYDLLYSTATIRNEMAALEEEGLLEKTHTSSGRVPSTEGYRYYVENLMDTSIDENLALTIQNAFQVHALNTEEVIKLSCDVLSRMTNLTTMVLGPEAEKQKLQHIKVFPIDEKSAVVVFITDTGHTENKMFQFDEAVSVNDIQNCCDILNDRLVGTPIVEIVDKMESIRPILAKTVQRHDILFRAFVEAFIKFANENVYFSGKDNLLYQPEFADIEKLRTMMRLLDNSAAFRSIHEGDGALTLQRDSNNSLVWKDDFAVVSSKFHVTKDEVAQLMLVGPSRMDYDKVVNLLKYVSERVEKILRKGEDND